MLYALDPTELEFPAEKLVEFDTEGQFLQNNVFGNEATFHVCRLVHRHDIRILNNEDPRSFDDYERNN